MSKNRIPGEKATAPRSDLLETFRQTFEAGLVDPLDDEGSLLEAIFVSFGGQSSPKDGWAILSSELRLIRLLLPGRATEYTLGRAKIADNCNKYANELSALRVSIDELTYSLDFLSAQLDLNINEDFFDNLVVLAVFADQLRRTAGHIQSRAQPPKWKSTQNRQVRVELAVSLTPLFEEQFGQPAKPVGGSASLDVNETNDWTRFYQMAAKAFWNEAVSPDRQAILREAALPPAV